MNGRILIVHSAAVMRMMVRQSLVAHGYDVVGQGENGQQAVQKYRELRPDVVTVDMVLPELDGIDTIRAIVAEFPQASIVVCTSGDEPVMLVNAIRAGAKSFLTKPFGPAKLIASIEKILAAAR